MLFDVHVDKLTSKYTEKEIASNRLHPIEIAFFNGVASGNDILLELLHVKRHHYLANNYIFTCTFKTFNRQTVVTCLFKETTPSSHSHCRKQPNNARRRLQKEVSTGLPIPQNSHKRYTTVPQSPDHHTPSLCHLLPPMGLLLWQAREWEPRVYWVSTPITVRFMMSSVERMRPEYSSLQLVGNPGDQTWDFIKTRALVMPLKTVHHASPTWSIPERRVGTVSEYPLPWWSVVSRSTVQQGPPASATSSNHHPPHPSPRTLVSILKVKPWSVTRCNKT